MLSATGDRSPRLHKVVERCTAADPRRRFRDVPDLRMAIAGNSNKRLYIVIISFLVVMTAILGWFAVVDPAL